MKSPVPDYLDEILRACGDDDGAPADYIPQLAAADPERLAVCVSTVDGHLYASGDADAAYSIQSISKPFVYALALLEHGLDHVLERVGVEPSGEAFDELSLESDSRRPLNPMINAGALTAHALVGEPGDDADARFARIHRLMSDCAGRELDVDEGVCASEMETAYRNLAIANLLRSYDVINQEPLDVVSGYTRQCAVSVTTRDLAMMAATLGSGGRQPMTGKQVLPPEVVRQVLSVMMTCGMYNAAGDWMSTVGFPAKSGVSGGILGVLPGQVGIATFSPRLDAHGNSTRGVRLCTRMSADMGMHIMQAPEPARATVRRDRTLRGPDGSLVRVVSLQGSIQFSGAERVLRIVADGDPVAGFVLDLRRVASTNGVARRMLAELVRRLQLDGTQVALLDPGSFLPLPDDAVVTQPRRLDTLDRYAEHDRV
ncbi:glutaminase [Luteipulveratus halotolerans]|uniref:Glutaminase n=1 Tax=Luteipulveratus halotolerans TaxID=1631356 RepID=A0A0L6CMM9_9MICO|nr:glutaminase [Luteipulveratus halotolerans]KNX38808.1 glutaminase [Luteipulveratus halotolerans]